MKKMILSILAIALIISGTILGAYLSYNFEKDVQIRQEKIEQLNKDIENIVVTGKLLNEEILLITSNTKKLTENVQTITNNIQDAQGNLNDITESTKKLVDENILIAQQANLMIDKLTKFQTGGGSYIKVDVSYNDGAISLGAFLIGNNPMRNVLIAINDNGVNKDKRENSIDEFFNDPSKLTDSRKRSYFQVKYDLINNNIFTSFGIGIYSLVRLNAEDYGKDLDFLIAVEADNGTTIQFLEWKDFRNSKNKTSQIIKYTGGFGKGGVTIDTIPGRNP